MDFDGDGKLDVLVANAAIMVALADAPAGYTEAQRGKAGGFIGDPDVMDTWATTP